MPSMQFDWTTRTFLMGIVNVSPDSFAGDGVATVEAAVELAMRMVRDGADIIEVGGESTRPGSAPIPMEEELSRVVPAVTSMRHRLTAPISVDTYKSGVAGRALDAGAAMINDIWALRQDPGLAQLAADRKVPIIMMSNQRDGPVDDIMAAITADLKRAVGQAVDAGVPPHNIIIDPGIGFGKSFEQNLEIVRRLAELKTLGQPVLLGTSRKSMIGLVLDLPADQRLEGTAATVAIGIANGADIVRVHDVKQMVRVCRMSDAIIRRRISRD